MLAHAHDTPHVNAEQEIDISCFLIRSHALSVCVAADLLLLDLEGDVLRVLRRVHDNGDRCVEAGTDVEVEVGFRKRLTVARSRRERLKVAAVAGILRE